MIKEELERRVIDAAIDVFEWNRTLVILNAKESSDGFSNDFRELGLALFELSESNK